jgi:cation diffusion facilitator family transporter
MADIHHDSPHHHGPHGHGPHGHPHHHEHHDEDRAHPGTSSEPASRTSAWERVRTWLRHDHDHGGGLPPDDAAIHATKVSLAALALTACLQLAIVVLSGSVALLSDTIHNFADALTAIPLWAAFVLHRRPPNRHFTHGYNRAEDFAGLLVLLVIGASVAVVVYESVTRLLHPRPMEHAAWVIAAGMLGALGNEFVARYRIRAGRRIGSAALTADGVHARTDALTSLVVVAAGIGGAFGWAWVDPAAGLLVALIILLMLGRSAARIFGRMLDAVDPALCDLAVATTAAVEGVRGVNDLRLRWHGHRLEIVTRVAVDPGLSVEQGHLITEHVEHALMHAFPQSVGAVVHVDPDGVDSHELTRHHL